MTTEIMRITYLPIDVTANEARRNVAKITARSKQLVSTLTFCVWAYVWLSDIVSRVGIGGMITPPV